MKTFNTLKLALFFIAAISMVSCAKKLAFTTSTVVPSAEGYVKYKKDGNNNYKIDLKVVNLADPTKLVPSKSSYVLWMQSDNNGVKNMGQIKSSSGWFSSTRKASISTVSSFQPKSFFITAEDNVDLSYPGNQVVLRTE